MFKLKSSKYTPQARMKIILPQLEGGLAAYGQLFAQQLNAVTGNWRHQVGFAQRTEYRDAATPYTGIYIINRSTSLSQRYGGTYGDLWNWVEGGTRPHSIQPRADNPWGRLFFMGGDYAPKTSPGLFYGGPGQVIGGGLVASRGVQHPGTTARRFIPGFDNKLAPERRQAVDGAMRVAFRLLAL
jgi:hypothetical protein